VEAAERLFSAISSLLHPFFFVFFRNRPMQGSAVIAKHMANRLAVHKGPLINPGHDTGASYTAQGDAFCFDALEGAQVALVVVDCNIGVHAELLVQLVS
jgi:hypothetical protein